MVGHFDVEKTIAVLHKYLYLSKLRHNVRRYIKLCITYAIAKHAIKKQRLYTLLPNPNKPWELVSMDYMSGLISTKHGNDYLFVVID